MRPTFSFPWTSLREKRTYPYSGNYDTFSDILEALRGKLPWETDVKHCKDRYTLLTRTFKKNDNIDRSSTGVEEEFGEKETVLTSLTEEAAFWKEKRSHERTKHQNLSQNLLAAGREARALALARCAVAYVSTFAGYTNRAVERSRCQRTVRFKYDSMR
jgi:hypothetical protein